MHEADFLCSQLASHGIDTSIPDQGTIGVFPLYGSALGGIRIQVNEADYEKATAILREMAMASEERKSSCPKCGSTNVQYKRQSWFFAALVVLFVGIPLLWLKKEFQCHSCGHRWEEDPVNEKAIEVAQGNASDASQRR